MNLIRKRKCRLKIFYHTDIDTFPLIEPNCLRPSPYSADIWIARCWTVVKRENSINANKNCTFIDNSEFHYIINCVSRYVWISLLENLLQWVISKNKNIHLYCISIITLRNLIKYNFIDRLKKKSYIWR